MDMVLERKNNPDLEYMMAYHCLHPSGSSPLTTANRALVLRLAFHLDAIDITGRLTPDWEMVKRAPGAVLRRLAQFCIQARAREEALVRLGKTPDIHDKLLNDLRVVS